jgi:hypothetical protein
MQVSRKLRTASSVMAWLALAGAAVLATTVPLAYLAPFDFLNAGGAKLGFHVSLANGLEITTAIPLLYRLGALAAAMVPTGLTLWALLVLFRLFRAYAAGRVFDDAALNGLKQLAGLLFLIVLASKAEELAATYIVSLSQNTRWIGMSVSFDDFTWLFVAGVAVVIARVMAEAHKLARENETFI